MRRKIKRLVARSMNATTPATMIPIRAPRERPDFGTSVIGGRMGMICSGTLSGKRACDMEKLERS